MGPLFLGAAVTGSAPPPRRMGHPVRGRKATVNPSSPWRATRPVLAQRLLSSTDTRFASAITPENLPCSSEMTGANP